MTAAAGLGLTSTDALVRLPVGEERCVIGLSLPLGGLQRWMGAGFEGMEVGGPPDGAPATRAAGTNRSSH